MTTKEDRMKSYERYAKARERSKIKNDSTLASMVGIHPSTLSDWKKGRSQPNAINMMRIARVLNVPLEKIVKI